MKTVSKFESKLLRILYGVVGYAPLSQAVPLIEQPDQAPPGLSRDAVDLIEQALSLGVTRFLAKNSGWQRARFIRQDAVADGRLWERTQPAALGLEYSRQSIRLLIWLTTRGPKDRWPTFAAKATKSGDQVLQYLVIRLARNSSVPSRILQSRRSIDNPLVLLNFPDLLSNQDGELEIESFIAGPSSWLIECLQQELADNWIRLERAKKSTAKISQMVKLGDAQSKVLDSYFAALLKLGRTDLARFVLVAASALLGTDARAKDWVGRLDVENSRMAERQLAFQAAFSFLRHAIELRRWNQRYRSVGYFDEEYAQSQLWKGDWEFYNGDRVCVMAESLMVEVDPMGQAKPTAFGEVT